MRRGSRRPSADAREGRPRGSIDGPTEAIISRGEVHFHGWALVGELLPDAVDIVLGDGQRVAATIGIDRPDVPLNLGRRDLPASSGWTAAVDTTALLGPEVRVKVEVTGQAGAAAVAERLYELRGDGVRGSVDLPVDGDTLVDTVLVVSGWASAPAGVNNVDVYLDGNLRSRARLGVPRPDVYAASPISGPVSGFLGRIGLKDEDAGVHVVTVTMTLFDGRVVALGSPLTIVIQRLAVDPDPRLEVLQEHTQSWITSRMEAPRSDGQLLVFTHSLALGGGQLYLQDLLRGLIPHLASCTVVADADGILASELQQMGADVVINRRAFALSEVEHEGAVRETATFIAASGCSTVLSNTLGTWISVDAAQRAGVPTVWAIHESFALGDWLSLNWGGAAPPYVEPRLRHVLRNTDRVVFEADATRTMYIADGVPEDRALTIRYGVDLDEIDAHSRSFDRAAARRENGIAEDAVVLVCVGVFEARKNQAWLAETFDRVAAAHPTAILALVGRHPSEYAEAVDEVIAARNLAGRVLTIPITPDIRDWYAIADVLVSASDIESFPRSMIEAMAYGCPVLSTSVFGVPELIEDGITGWLTESNDTRSLAAGLHRVLRLTTAERRAVGETGREHVHRHHRHSGYVAAYRKILDGLRARHEVH